MAIDPYTNCPCGSGKKIKFCCRDLAPEIEKIERLLEADQRHACLEHIEQLEKKFPDRSYLQMRKASLLRQLGRIEEADTLLKELVHRDASNPVAWAEAVFLVLDREDQEFRVAVELLQRAIEASGENMPSEVLEAIALVAQYAHAFGMPLVCLKHMYFYLEREPEARNAFVALLRFQQSPKISPLIKDAAWLPTLPEGEFPEDAAAEYEGAEDAANSGLLRNAERQFVKLSEAHPQSPTIWRSLGLVRGWLGDNASAVEAFRTLSTLDIPFDDAAEAEALAQVLDDEDSETIDVVELEFTTADLEQTRNTLKESKQVHELPGEVNAEGDEPPPRALALLFDRPLIDNAENATYDELPSVIARLAYFGKEVDRPARVNLVVQSDRMDDARAKLLKIGGEVLTETQGAVAGSETDETWPRVVGQISRYAAPFSDRKYVPDDTSAERRYEIIQDDRREKLLSVWTQGELPPLGGKSPVAASKGDTADRVRLAGVILNMELASQRESVSATAFDQLRQQLEIPTPVAPTDRPLAELPLVRLSRLEPGDLSDDDLLATYMRATTNRFPPAIVKLGQEVLNRQELIDGQNSISPEEICGQLAELHEDTRLALEWNERAREFSLKAGASCAGNDLFELYVRLNRGEGERAVELLQHLMDRHSSEPGVRNAVAQVLRETGLMNADGTMARSKESALMTPDDGDEPGKIWTPDAEAATAGGGESKLWLPD